MSNSNPHKLDLPEPSLYDTIHAREHMTPAQLGHAMVLNQTLRDLDHGLRQLDDLLFSLAYKTQQAKNDLRLLLDKSSLDPALALDRLARLGIVLKDAREDTTNCADLLRWQMQRPYGEIKTVLDPMRYERGKTSFVSSTSFEKLTDH